MLTIIELQETREHSMRSSQNRKGVCGENVKNKRKKKEGKEQDKCREEENNT